MLTMSSSGGKWLAQTIADHLPNCRYYNKEFFNPICNLKHERVLRKNFGSELASCYRNIASAGDLSVHRDIERTWGVENYTFTKEVFSPFKLRVFMSHFRCFALLRRTEDCLPPARLRVWSFYEHAWQALYEAGYEMDAAASTIDRAFEAHRLIYEQIEYDATRLNVPILRFEQLMHEPAETIRPMIERAVGFVSDAMIEQLISTRYTEPKPVPLEEVLA